MEERYSDCSNIKERLTIYRVGKNVCADAPKISVIIPAYNITPFITETLDSVFAQTYKNFEVILVNDGSPDTAELETALEPYFDKIIYAKQENLGASEARNAAICLARGEILAFLDGDDVWFPNFLEAQLNHLEKNNFEMIYCDALIFGELLFAGKTYMQTAPSSDEVTPVSLISTDCNVITSGTILKKDLVIEFGMFDKELRGMEDFDLWFRLAKNGARIGYQRAVLLKYRMRPNSLSGTNVERAKREIYALDVIRLKYELSKTEQIIWEKRRAIYEASLEMEKCKSCLATGDFKQAQKHITEANKYYKKPKFTIIAGLLRFSPKLTLHLFKKLRPAEFSFIVPNNLQK